MKTYAVILIVLKTCLPLSLISVIITGAHLFPYSWFYKTNLFVIFAGVIAIGALILGLNIPTEKMYLIPIFVSISLIILTILLYIDSKKKQIV